MARTIAAASAGSTRNRGVLLLAALFGVLSAGLMFAFLSSQGSDKSAIEDALNSGEGAETVVILTRDVGVGEKITSDMLTTRPVPAGALLPGRITNPDEVVGKVAVTPLFAGEQALSSKVTSFEGQTTLAYKVPEGMRALSLQIPHEAWAAAGLVQPGDRVDVLGITVLEKVDPLTGEMKPQIVSGLIGQDIEVLAVAQVLVKGIPNTDLRAKQRATPEGTTTSGGVTPVAGSNTTAENQPVPEPKDGESETYHEAISITLAVTPDLAAKIAIIDAMKDDVGQYRILPRQKGDAQLTTGQQTWTLEEVFIQGTKK